jgi:hypothetical protein
MLGLDYRFDDALMLLAKHPPEAARDNHLNQLLGVAVSQFCGLPHHAQRYLAQLGQYQAGGTDPAVAGAHFAGGRRSGAATGASASSS